MFKVFTLINSIFSLFITASKYGNEELKSSITIRQELEKELNLKKVSILIAKIEAIQELELSEEDKDMLTTNLQSKVQALLN